MRNLSTYLLCMLTACLSLMSAGYGAEETRNPFGVKDVANPDGEDVQTFARAVKLSGKQADANAVQWVMRATPGDPALLDGSWSSRWGSGAGQQPVTGAATIRSVEDRVYIVYRDKTSAYLIDARRRGDRLVGRYHNLALPGDTTPWVGKIVDNERIDGIWQQGRWDFRRRLSQSK